MPWTELGPATCNRSKTPGHVTARCRDKAVATVAADFLISRTESYPHQRLFERACPGPLDHPHRAKFYLLSFIVQNYWSRWLHHRRCFADLRRNGKIYCKPDETWDTVMARGGEDAIWRKIEQDLKILGCVCPGLGLLGEIDLLADILRWHFLWMVGLHSPAAVEFIRLALLWIIAGLDYTWRDRPPVPQQQNIMIYRGGEAPFHHIDKPSPRETIRLLTLYRRTGDVAARNTIVAGYLDDAIRISRRYRTDNADDLAQDAAEALIEAVEKYAASHEAAFSTFMYGVVEKRCIDSLRRQRRHNRLISTEAIAGKSEAALGPYASNPTHELKIFRELFKNT
jgi:hypothetical protein